MSSSVIERNKEHEIVIGNDFRKKIFELEETMAKIPGATFGDSPEMPLKHSFSDGMYVREIFLPKGHILTGKIHKHSHPNFLMSGEVIVVTENGGREHLKGPLAMISEPGTKRAIVALEDTVWITVHLNLDNGKNLEKIEEYVIAKTYDDPVLNENLLVSRNCLILALKEKGRDYKCLIDLPKIGTLLPFKEAIQKLKDNGVSLDGLLAKKNDMGEWHVTVSEGEPIEDISVSDTDLVGTWGGVAIGGGAVVSSLIGANKKQAQVPLETPEQRAARQKLMNFANTGTFGDFTAGAQVPLGYGDYNVTPIEQQGQTALQNMLNGGLPKQFAAGDAALNDYLKTNPTDVAAQFDPFSAQVDRQTNESQRALKRSTGALGNLYSTDTIRNLGDIQARANETKASQLASLTDNALNRRLQAIPLAYQSGEAQQAAQLSQIAASQNYGSLTRQLNDASIKARDAELLRRRNELQLPIQAATAVSGQQANFGVPSVQTNPYGDLLNLAGQLGGQYLSNRQTNSMLDRYYQSGSGSTSNYGYNPYAQGNLPTNKFGIGGGY